ncbi:DHHA1 domain-containing protein [Tardisphaera miroshnichenkoae]
MKASVISHSADVDGLMAAFFAMVREESRGNSVEVKFSDYDDMLSNLESSDGELIYVSDLGIDREKEQQFVSLVKDKIARGATVTYIDHHPDSAAVLQALRDAGAQVIHSLDDCAGVLAYSSFQDEIPQRYAIYAAYAAIGDHMERGKVASQIMAGVDSILAYFEASVLTLGIDKKDNIKPGLLAYLKQSPFAHGYPGVMEAASRQLTKMEEFTKRVFEVERGKRYSWAHSDCSFFTGRAATLMLQLLPIDVAVAYRLDDERNAYDVSFRCAARADVDLGALAHDAATSVGGTGGGHKKASGASVPADRLQDFLRAVAQRLRGSALLG